MLFKNGVVTEAKDVPTRSRYKKDYRSGGRGGAITFKSESIDTLIL